MKFKDLLPVVCVALLLISEFFLFSANRQKSLALTKWHQSQQQLADLQSQLDQATNSFSDTESDELARLRADNQDLPRLRAQIEQLQAANDKLSRQLDAARQAATQRGDQLQELQAEDEQAAEEQQAQQQAADQTAAAQKATCINNLRLIYAAKQAWALDKNKTDTDTPTEQDLLPYLKGNLFPICPSGGTYTIGPVGQPPTCSIPGHALPSQ